MSSGRDGRAPGDGLRPRCIVVLGDAMLDEDVTGSVERVAPDAPVPVLDAEQRAFRPGGAALAAALLRRVGHEVVLLTALADDEPGRRLRELLAYTGVEVDATTLHGATPHKVRMRAGAQALLRLDHGSAIAPVSEFPAGTLARWRDAAVDAVLVADYGRGVADRPEARLLVRSLDVPVVWDPHPRSDPPPPGVALLTPNHREAVALAGTSPSSAASSSVVAQASAAYSPAAEVEDAFAAARRLLDRFGPDAVAVTCGPRGAVLVARGAPPVVIPPLAHHDGDCCGAGDAFAGAAALALAQSMGMQDAVAAAVGAAATYVADGGPAAWDRPPRPADALTGTGLAEVAERVARLRSLGRTVVSTSGCFDLLHVGHLQMLHRARALGDHLVVLLNSDASVRRLKGPPRPFQNEHDRAQLLRGVGCVDDVVVFDEATPIDALRVLRPHLFVKGGDYSIEDLPEAAVAHDWGGSVVVVPYLPGYSTTSLAARAAAAEPRFR